MIPPNQTDGGNSLSRVSFVNTAQSRRVRRKDEKRLDPAQSGTMRPKGALHGSRTRDSGVQGYCRGIFGGVLLCAIPGYPQLP